MFRWLVIVLMLLLAGNVLALDNPEQKASDVIKDYILAKYPDWSRDEVRLTFKFAEKTFDELKGLDEGVAFRVLEVYPEFKPLGSVIFPVEIQNGEDSRKIFLRVKVEILKKIAAASRRIKKGKVIEAGDLKLEERDVALLPQKYFLELEPLAGKEAKINIPSNGTVFEWMVGDLPLVRKGSEVTILVSAPGLTVKTKGEALEDGYLDGSIKVKRKDSRKTIMAVVVSESEVEVKL